MPDTLYESQDNSSSFTTGLQGGNYRHQNFTPSITHNITSVSFKCFRLGSPGTVEINVYGVDGSGNPTGASLASGTIDGNGFGTGNLGLWQNIAVSGAGSFLLAGIQYVVVAKIQGDGGSPTDLVYIRINTSNDYAGGFTAFSSDSGGTWTQNLTYDLAFREYGLRPSKTLTADASISKDGETKTFTADASLIEPKKTFTVQASISKDGLLKTLTADAHISDPPDGYWPLDRAGGYDPDKFWDEEAQSWYAITTETGSERAKQSGGNLRNNIVVISNQGKIYFGA